MVFSQSYSITAAEGAKGMWKKKERNELDSLEQTGTNEKESRVGVTAAAFGSSGNDIHTPERTHHLQPHPLFLGQRGNLSYGRMGIDL
mgnify:CR=1 FL=1